MRETPTKSERVGRSDYLKLLSTENLYNHANDFNQNYAHCSKTRFGSSAHEAHMAFILDYDIMLKNFSGLKS